MCCLTIRAPPPGVGREVRVDRRSIPPASSRYRRLYQRHRPTADIPGPGSRDARGLTQRRLRSPRPDRLRSRLDSLVELAIAPPAARGPAKLTEKRGRHLLAEIRHVGAQ